MLRVGISIFSSKVPWGAVLNQRRFASSKNYYDILKVKHDCSSDEIKKSFITLSKQLHPDRNPQDPSSHKKFVAVNEAYKVLGKPATRMLYDQQLNFPTESNFRSASWHNQPPDTTRGWNWYQSSAWNQPKPEEDAYYGIKGVKRVPTKWIGIGCVVIAVLSGAIQLMSLRYRLVHDCHNCDVHEEKLASYWMEARQRAEDAGSLEAQVAAFEKRQTDTRTPTS